ncbi:UNVERIFIED_CONTAM: hypothetical protein GTU68_033639 [Idotea baltica]|nr:hypothetical protein [Idotea baltica]
MRRKQCYGISVPLHDRVVVRRVDSERKDALAASIIPGLRQGEPPGRRNSSLSGNGARKDNGEIVYGLDVKPRRPRSVGKCPAPKSRSMVKTSCHEKNPTSWA